MPRELRAARRKHPRPIGAQGANATVQTTQSHERDQRKLQAKAGFPREFRAAPHELPQRMRTSSQRPTFILRILTLQDSLVLTQFRRESEIPVAGPRCEDRYGPRDASC